jgi:hypothetical protein
VENSFKYLFWYFYKKTDKPQISTKSIPNLNILPFNPLIFPFIHLFIDQRACIDYISIELKFKISEQIHTSLDKKKHNK